MALVLIGSGSNSHQEPEDITLLLNAVRNGEENEVRDLLNDGKANVCEKNEDGQTAIHLAVLYSRDRIIKLLVEKGADIESADGDGYKPLHLAVKSGDLFLVELLLSLNAQVESFNVKTQVTAFCQAIESGHEEIAKSLLECGADINTKLPNGGTVLHNAVEMRKLALVEFLLQHGADKSLLEEDGFLDQLASGDETDQQLLRMLQKVQKVRGPSIENPKKVAGSYASHVPSFLATEDHIDRINVCHDFEATIVDFFVGEHEERAKVQAPVFDLLYGIGPDAIVGLSKNSDALETKSAFRWYHLPANNMAWVEALVGRIVAERRPEATLLDDDLKSTLGLSNASGRQYRASTAHSSFMRPLCRPVKSEQNYSLGDSTRDHVMMFMPFLHFETYNAYKEMFSVVSKVKSLIEEGRDFPPSSTEQIQKARQSRLTRKYYEARAKSAAKKKAFAPEFEEMAKSLKDFLGEKAPIRFKDAVGRKFTFPFHMAATWAGMEELIKQAFLHVDVIGPHVQEGHYDLIGPTGDIILPQVWETLVEPGWTVTMHMWPLPEPRHGPPPMPGNNFRPGDGRHGIRVHQKSSRGPPGPPPSTYTYRGAVPPPPPGNSPGGPPPPRPHNSDSGGPPIIIVPGGHSTKSSAKKKRNATDKGILAWQAGKPHPKSTKSAAKPAEPPQSDMKPASPRLRGGSGRRSPFLNFISRGESSKSAKRGATDDEPNPAQENADTEPEAAVEESEDEDLGQETHNPPAPWPLDSDTGGSIWKGKQPDRSGTQTETQTTGTFERKAPQGSNPDKDLIMAYLFPTKPGEIPPLQPRRTLDQYFYTHLESTSQRDADQVVYRYTLGTSEAKIFMVDQLWLWVLNEDVVISCFPQRWQSEIPVEQAPGGADQDGKSKQHPTEREVRFMVPESSTSRDREPSRHANRDDNRSIQSSVSSFRKAKRTMREDSMDVQQAILKYLESKARAPITNIYELANLITNSCVNVFDQYSVPDAFQFLEFFERSIGKIADQEAQCLQEFTDSLDQKNAVLDIKKETRLLVEIKDISDELDILKIVLDEQKKTLEDMDRVTKDHVKERPTAITTIDENLSLENNRVLESHLYRIEKMKIMTRRSYKGLQHILDLKQKQANFSEALSARKQSEHTSHQAELARELADRSLEQAQLAREQAVLTTQQTMNTADQLVELNAQTALAREAGKETERQGKTMLMFTVVTIIFLPMSFMAAFFAISLEVFPFNDNGRMPLPFVLKYILSISGALSIPFIVVAFQQERISNWYKIAMGIQPFGSEKDVTLSRNPVWLKKVPWALLSVWVGALAVITLGLIVPITLIWTRPLASGVQTAVTVSLLFVGGFFAVGYAIHRLVSASISDARSSSYGSSISLRDD